MIVTFDAVRMAVGGGADTYRKIADALGVNVDEHELAATINFMVNQHHQLAWADNCCTNEIEHTYDCRMVLL